MINLKSILWKVNGGVQRLDDKLEHIQFLTGNTLKVIAVLTMIVDHICKIVLQWLLTDGYWGVMLDSGKMSWEQYQQIDYFIRFDLQSIGTIAFPLFCFLLTEGFKHTRNRKHYIKLMFIFALISEIPFDIGFFSRYSIAENTFPFYFKYQNVFFTLFLGLVALTCLEKFSSISAKRTDKIRGIILQIISVAVIGIIAELFRCDYGLEGILYIAAFMCVVKTGFIRCCYSCWHIWLQQAINRHCVRCWPVC